MTDSITIDLNPLANTAGGANFTLVLVILAVGFFTFAGFALITSKFDDWLLARGEPREDSDTEPVSTFGRISFWLVIGVGVAIFWGIQSFMNGYTDRTEREVGKNSATEVAKILHTLEAEAGFKPKSIDDASGTFKTLAADPAQSVVTLEGNVNGEPAVAFLAASEDRIMKVQVVK